MLKKLNLLWIQSNRHIIIQNLFLIFSIGIFIVILHIFAEKIADTYIKIEQVEYIGLILTFFLFFGILFTGDSIYKFLSQLFNDSRVDFIETLLFILAFTIFDYKILIILLYILTFFISLYLFENWYKNKPKPNKNNGILLGDNPINTKEEDTLGFTAKVIDFIDIVHNNGSSEQFVYGLEAPWGHGKSTFLSIFKKIINKDDIANWIPDTDKKNEIEEKTTNIKIFEFNPWHFNSDADLLEKFFEEFKLFLCNEYYLPELSGIINQLTEKLDGVSNKVTGVKVFHNKTTLENTKKSIRNSLNKIDDKILIIIDDLDRIPSKKLKTIFSLIDLAKSFPKVNFIVCYDSCNFNHIEDTLKDTVTVTESNAATISSEKVNNNNLVEYISKIINVKYNIYIEFEAIKSYLVKLINTRFIIGENNFQQKLEEELDILFTGKSFEILGPYLFNIRAVKRLINHLLCKYYGDEKYLNDLFRQVDKEISDNNDFSISTQLVVEILELYHSKLYRDILFEANGDIDNDIFYISEKNKYCLGEGFKDQISENPRFENYINSLNIKERNIILYLFPMIRNSIKNDLLKSFGLREKKQFQLYFNYNKKQLLFNQKINVVLGENRKEVYLYSSNIEELLKIFQNLIITLGEEYLDIFIDRINKVISIQQESTTIAKNLFNFYISNEFKEINNGEILNTYDGIRLLNDGVGKHNSTENCKYIGDFLYGENVIEKLVKSNVPDKLILAIRMMNTLYEGNYYNFSRGMVDGFELNNNKNYYIAKISRIIFKNFKETYITKKNIFKLEGFQRHILYYISLYIGRFYDNEENINDISKIPEGLNHNLNKLLECDYYNEFQNYIFDFCLQGEGKEEIFFNHFSIYIRDADSYFNRNNSEIAFKFEGIESQYILHPEKTIEFVKTNFDSLRDYITQNKDKTFTIEDKESKTLGEIGMIILNYFTEEPKKENS